MTDRLPPSGSSRLQTKKIPRRCRRGIVSDTGQRRLCLDLNFLGDFDEIRDLVEVHIALYSMA